MNRKMIRTGLLLLCWHLSALVAYSQFSSKWGDQGNGTYHNPVLPADFSDLDAIRVGDDYYAISSTMQFSPGMAVLHSKDLVNWTIISHVASDLTAISPELNWDRMDRYGRGIWAGSIRYYKNKFWVYFGTPEEGFFMSSAPKASGPWEPLHQVWNVKGWDDCCSFCDDDGQLYFIATNFALDPKNGKKYNIHLFKLSPDGKKLQMDSDTIIHQSLGSEANKLYKIRGYYYHYFSEVNSQGGRQIMMERAKNLHGPWSIKQLNRVDPAKDREPNQGGLLQVGPDNWYFFTHHGHGDWEGRPASLLPVTWVNDWPIIGEVGKDTIGQMVWSGVKPIKSASAPRLQTSDDFNSPTLAQQWEWNYQPRAAKWSTKERPGWLRLHAFKPIEAHNFFKAGNTLTQRSYRTSHNEVIVKVDVSGLANGQRAGLAHFGHPAYASLGVTRKANANQLELVVSGKVTQEMPLRTSTLWLKSTWRLAGRSQYAYSLDGRTFTDFGAPYQLVWGAYRGDRIALFSYNDEADAGHVDIDYLHYDYKK